VADYVTVANLALSKLGEDDQIRDPDQDSHAARIGRAVWDADPPLGAAQGQVQFLDDARRARRAGADRARLPKPYPFANRFPVPATSSAWSRCSTPRRSSRTYKFERKAVLADSDGPVFIRYVARRRGDGDWDDLFVQAFAARLAFQIADRITGDRGRKADCWAEYRARSRTPAGVDAKEDPPEEPMTAAG
jgi:hypothetical protein